MSKTIPNHEHLASFLCDLAYTGRAEVHAQREIRSGRPFYSTVQRFPNADDFAVHLTSEHSIGIYLVSGSAVRAAVFDLDDHGGTLGFEYMRTSAIRLADELRSAGFKPLIFSSGGGKGVHIWLVWSEPQSAKDVRGMLASVAEHAGFRNGTAGVAKGEVEIFPKQDDVPVGKFGNLIALPLSRSSRLLAGPDLTPISNEEFRPPVFSNVYSPPVPEIENGRKAAHGYSRLPNDEQEVLAALKHVPAEDYDTWIRMGFILKREFNDKEGFALWDGWSRSCKEKYPGQDAAERRWETFPQRADVGIGTLFYEAKKRGWNGPTNPVIREMNARFGIYTHGNKTMIIVKNGERRADDEFAWLSKDAFSDRLKRERLTQSDDDTGRDKAKYWMQHPLASHYHRLEFDPEKSPGHNGLMWNLWRGFAVDPRPGDWRLLQEHIFENICNGNETHAKWLLNWMALAVQKPSHVIGTAPVLKGLPGTGKGILANMFGRIWGVHYTTITNESHVSGRFNAHLNGKRFVFVDEGTFGGNRKDAGTIKTRITEEWFIMEPKGVDPIRMRNRMIFMFASNETSIVAADKADRRFQVLEVGDRHRNDRSYFAAIVRQMEEGGYEAMLHDLLARDLGDGPDPHITIKTDALFEQILYTQPPEMRYLFHILDEARLPQNEVAGPTSTTIKAMYSEFQSLHPDARYVSMPGLARFIKSAIPDMKTYAAGKYVVPKFKGGGDTERSTRYTFPDLPLSRGAFEIFVGQRVPWSNDLTAWQSDTDGEPV